MNRTKQGDSRFNNSNTDQSKNTFIIKQQHNIKKSYKFIKNGNEKRKKNYSYDQ